MRVRLMGFAVASSSFPYCSLKLWLPVLLIGGVMTIRTNAKEFEIKVVPLKQQLHFTSPVRSLILLGRFLVWAKGVLLYNVVLM